MRDEKRELMYENVREAIHEDMNEETREEMREEANEDAHGTVSEEVHEDAHGITTEKEDEEMSDETRRKRRGINGIISEEMREMLNPALRLFIICLATALCLALVNDMTKGTIELRNQQEAEEQRMQVMTAADSFEKLEGWEDQDESGLVKEVYAALSGDELIGYVFATISPGYGGDIAVTVGVGNDRTITGIKVGENQETPGLGSKIADEKFTVQYEGKDIAGEIKIVTKPVSAEDEIQAVSGATVSTRAVNSAVQASADLGMKLLQQNGGGGK